MGALSWAVRSRYRLHANAVETLALAGISTSGIVLSAIRSDTDYPITGIADACASLDPELHLVLTQKVFASKRWCPSGTLTLRAHYPWSSRGR